MYLNQLQRAKGDGNSALTQQALNAFAQADHIDTYWTILNARLSRAIISGSATPPATAMLATIGYMSAIQSGGPEALMASCKNIANEPTAQERCRASAALLQQADTIWLEAVGVSLALQALPSDSPAYRALKGRQKDAKSRLFAGAKYERLMYTQNGVDKYITLMAENRRERDVIDLWNEYAMKQEASPTARRRASLAAKVVAPKSL